MASIAPGASRSLYEASISARSASGAFAGAGAGAA